MTILISPKQEHFVLSTYRDQMPHTKKSISRLKQLAESFGPFAYLKKNGDSIKISLSQEPGYLLAETVLDYLKVKDQPWVVYLEESFVNKAIILVVANKGEVLKDALIPIARIDEILNELAQDNHPYQFYVAESKSSGLDISSFIQSKFGNAKSKCKLNKYPESIFSSLPSSKEYKMLEINKEIRVKKINKINYIFIAFVLTAASLGYFAYYQNQKTINEAEEKINKQHRESNRSAAFRLPDAKNIIQGIQENIIKVQYVSGWPIKKLTYTPGKLLVTIESHPTRNTYLKKWATSEGIYYNERNNQLLLSMRSFELNPTLRHQDNIHAAEKILLENLKKFLPEEIIHKGAVANKDIYKSTDFKIQINNQPTLILELIAKSIDKLPIEITNIQLSVETGAVSGTISLELRGV